MAGRRPKPIEAKILAGNPGKRRLPARVAKGPRGLTDPPPGLTRHAAEEWRRVAPELDQLGLLTTVDRAVLESYCEAAATMRECRAVIARHGRTFTTATGQVKARPEVKMMAEAARLVRQFAVEFGMTPSARTRVQPASTGQQPPLPGAETWPERPDPAKRRPPSPATDESAAAPSPPATAPTPTYSHDDYLRRLAGERPSTRH